jgi:hypothetical protein
MTQRSNSRDMAVRDFLGGVDEQNPRCILDERCTIIDNPAAESDAPSPVPAGAAENSNA